GYDVRVDHVIGPRQQIFARWSWKHLPALYPNYLLPLSHYDESDTNLVLSHNYTLKPNLVNESRFGLSLYRFVESFPIVGREAVATLGLEGLDLRNVGDGGGFPFFDFSGGTGFSTIGHGRETNSQSRNFQLADNLSWIKGSHTARFGLDIRRLGYAGTLIMPSSDFGALTFRAGAFSGNAFADLLLGLPQSSAYSVSGPNLSESAVHSHFYAQDTWRVSSRITLTFGLRWQLHPPMTEASGNVTNFDRTTGNVIIPDRTIAPAPGFLAGINACPGTTTAIPCTRILTASQVGLGSGLRRTDYSTWTPRLSFAYRPFSNNRTVVRAGLGIFTQTILGSTAYLLTGVHTSDSRSYTNYQGPGVAPLFVLPQVHTGDVGALPPPGAENFYSAADLNYKDPRSYQWNFTIERQLPGDTSLRLSYVGSHSIGMNLPVDLNQQHASTTPFSASRRPYLAWNHPVTFDNLGFASYHAMQAETTHRFGKGLFFQSSYAFSKNAGNAGGKFGGANSGAEFPVEAFFQVATDRFPGSMSCRSAGGADWRAG
ncbi:MAG: hypothetical protein NTY38_12840, partial [Acidobacteria bacterium]|nr:hypothetical protein [Acidobacteriota bacterium]